MNGYALFFKDPVNYAAFVQLQDRLVTARLSDSIPDMVLFMEHKPVITLGMRAQQAHVLMEREKISAMSIELHQSSRGGDVTYHAPGQLVIYPILRLREQEADAHAYVSHLESIGIGTTTAFGVPGFRRRGLTGVWTAQGKIAAIGVRIKRWVTIHGMSLNVNIDLAGFDTIVPCGLKNEKVTSLQAILGDTCPTLEKVRATSLAHFETILGRKMKVFREPWNLPDELHDLLDKGSHVS